MTQSEIAKSSLVFLGAFLIAIIGATKVIQVDVTWANIALTLLTPVPVFYATGQGVIALKSFWSTPPDNMNSAIPKMLDAMSTPLVPGTSVATSSITKTDTVTTEAPADVEPT